MRPYSKMIHFAKTLTTICRGERRSPGRFGLAVVIVFGKGRAGYSRHRGNCMMDAGWLNAAGGRTPFAPTKCSVPGCETCMVCNMEAVETHAMRLYGEVMHFCKSVGNGQDL